jgi:hypothetical protein
MRHGACSGSISQTLTVRRRIVKIPFAGQQTGVEGKHLHLFGRTALVRRPRVQGVTQIISLVKKNAYLGEKGLDTISPVW